MAYFKRTQTGVFSKYTSKLDPNVQYWKKYEAPVTVREFTAIDYIDVSPVEPHYIAVTTGPKIDLYHQQTARVWYSLTRFQRSAHGGNFRSDGQLLIAGSDDGQVKLFNYKLKQLLRVFKGHSGSVHRARFIRNKPHTVSFSDDKSITLWDIAEEAKIACMEDHKDFVRAGDVSPTSEHIVISGSYDHTVKMWDTRTATSVMDLPHGSPVESVLCYPSGSIFASAGGTEVRIWDAVAGKLLASLSQHHKTITCLSLASNGRCLVSGSLDKHVKVYDIDTYSTVHSVDYTDPVLAFGVAPGDSTLVAGMISGSSGLVSFRQRKQRSEEPPTKAKGSRGMSVVEALVQPGDQIIQRVPRQKLEKYDKHLNKFNFKIALDESIKIYLRTKDPTVAVAVSWELIRRQRLRNALDDRDPRSLNPIFKFVSKNFKNVKYRKVLLEFANTLIDLYGDSVVDNPRLVRLFTWMKDEVESELQLTKEYLEIMGAIELFLSVSDRDEMAATDEAMTAENLARSALLPMNIAASREASAHEVVIDIED